MFAWIIRLVILFAVLTAIYACLSAYMRWDQRKKLEADFDTRFPESEQRETFVAHGLKTYDRSLRKKLLLGVYGLPVLIVALLIGLAYMD